MRPALIMDTINCLYEDHIIKEEMVIGPVIIQEQLFQDILSDPVDKGSLVKAQDINFKFTVPQKKTDEDQKFICDICFTNFKYRRNLIQHIKQHSEEQNINIKFLVPRKKTGQDQKFICNICYTNFKFRGNLIRHIKLHSGEKFACNICKKNFKSKIYLTTHEKNHVDKNGKVTRKVYCCNLCSRQFNDKSNFNRHKRKYCKVLLDQVNESNCGSSETVKKDDTKIKVICICDICDKQYASKSSLVDHILKHNKNVTFCCRKCKKCFNNKRSLTRHLHLHKKVGNYECKVCFKKFDRVSSLKAHNGSKDKQLVTCKVCIEQFSCKNRLRLHILEHNNENGRPYSCKLCKRGFISKHNLKSHKKSKCCSLSFSCGLCSKKYSQFYSLERHMMSVHNENTNTDKLVGC